ncbi:MAG: glycosyltransferase family 9 protein [Burkholderiaceae bacterium]
MSGAPAAARAQRWQGARRVLLVRLDNLGDVLMTTPAMAAVRRALPDAHLALLAAPAARALAPHLPFVDEVIGFHAPWVKAGAAALDGAAGHPPADGRAAPQPLGLAERRQVELLRAARFDAAVVVTVCTQSALPAALLCRMAGIGLVLAHCRERAYGLLSDAVPDPDELRAGMRHEVRRQLDLVAHVGFASADERLRFHLRDTDRAAAAAALRAAGVDPARPYVLVHPGASAASRRYPPAAYGAAAELIQRDPAMAGQAVVFCAGPGEEPLVRDALAAMAVPAAALARVQALGTLAALVAGARVLVANNSSPVHLAAAVGTPVVDLYALTNPQHTPWMVPARVLNHDVACRHCQQSVCAQGHHRCLRGVAPAEVAHAARSLWAGAAAGATA